MNYLLHRQKINEAILHGRAQSRIAYGTSIDKLTKKLNVNVKTKIGTKILKVFSLDLEATINQNSTSNNLNSFYKVDAFKNNQKTDPSIYLAIKTKIFSVR